MNYIYIIVAVVIVAALYFVFRKKGGEKIEECEKCKEGSPHPHDSASATESSKTSVEGEHKEEGEM